MSKYFKEILVALVIVGSVVAWQFLNSAHAQTFTGSGNYSVYPMKAFGGTNGYIAGTGASNITEIVDVTAYKNIGIAIKAKCYIASNSTLAITMYRSMDASLWDTNYPWTFTLAVATNSVYSVLWTNVDIGGYGFIKFGTATGGNNDVTNCSATYSLKPGS